MNLKAVIIGNYGATNLGDEAILENILSAHPDLSFTVFSNNPAETQSKYKVKSTYPLPFGLRSILRGKTTKSLEALNKCDFVIIGGGGLFTDEKIRAILLWGWHFFWAKHYKKPVFFYANSIGPLNSKIGRWITKKVFQKANFITVRDSASAAVLEKFGVKNFAITADPVFLTATLKSQTPKKKVAISLRNWITNEKNYIASLKETVVDLEKNGYQVLLINMQTFQDNDRNVLNQISSEKSLMITPRTFTELLKLLSECNFTIGMRLHFLIASALANIPFITLSYSQKTDSLAKKLQMEKYLLPLAQIKKAKLEKYIQKISAEENQIKESLAKKVQEEKQQAQKNITILKKFIAKILSKS